MPEDEIERILDDYPEHNTIAEHNAIKAELQQLLLLLLLQARIDELTAFAETLTLTLRGEDPEEYRPNDLIAMGYVEEIIQQTLRKRTP